MKRIKNFLLNINGKTLNLSSNNINSDVIMNAIISKDAALSILQGEQKVSNDTLMGIKNDYSDLVTYSKNIFLPLTRLCRNKCGYCTFRKEPKGPHNIMGKEEILSLVRSGQRNKCHEALFTFGERAETYSVACEELDSYGYGSMAEYIYDISMEIMETSDLLVHTNAGLLRRSELRLLREANASMGLMLESSSERLMEKEAHKNSPGKEPRLRLEMMRNAGKMKIPFTTGVLIGIGETDLEIYQSLLDIRKMADRHGNIQEIIIQNFVPKNNSPMEGFQPPSLEKIMSVISLARMMFPDISIQLPPNLNRKNLMELMGLGVDDLGGVSPITPDHVNPESPWPVKMIEKLGLVERLPVYPKFISKEFLSEIVYKKAIGLVSDDGFVRREENYD